MEEPSYRVNVLSSMTRRQLLGRTASGAVSVSLLSSPLSAFGALKETDAQKAFMTVSKVLTAQVNLSHQLGQLFFQEISKLDPDFGRRVSDLDLAIMNSKTGQLAVDLSAEQQRTAKQIVSAWYTGIVGVGSSRRVVTYRHALEFQAVDDVLDIRSYCSGKPGFWAQKPVERKV